jgi:hypothetical protein
MSNALPRLFHLQRDRDISGVSGTGRVANGILWPDGTVSLRWIGERPSTVHWDRLADAEHVHGHGGATRIVWADEDGDVTRAVILLAAANALDESERLRDLTDDHMHDVNAAANELRRMADEAAPMVGSFARDGFGADEIAEMLNADTARRIPLPGIPECGADCPCRRVPAAETQIETGTQQCGHDDYHDAHEWADRPGIWCPGHSLTGDEAQS